MRVLELVLKWGNGGAERYVEDLVLTGVDEGIDCRVASVATDVRSTRIEGCGPLVSGGVKGALFGSGALGRYVRSGAFDLVHVHGNNGLAFKFARVAKKAGAKAVVHSHNSSFGNGFRGAKGLFTNFERRLASSGCDGRFACSHAAGGFLFSGDPYLIAPNGVDTGRFAFNLESRTGTRARLGITGEAPVVGFAASLIDAKNPLMALEVFERVAECLPEACFVICGDGKLSDEVAAVVAASPMSQHCVRAGRVADIERYYSAMDVLLAPSKYEGLPINLIEAQANGLPVVMSDAITDEVVVVPSLCARVPLSATIDEWADVVVNAISKRGQRTAEYAEIVRRAGYSQPECFQVIFDFYREVL